MCYDQASRSSIYTSISLGLNQTPVRENNLRNNTSQRNSNTDNAPVTDGSARVHPAKCYNGARFDVTDDSARDRAGLRDDEELGDVDQGGKDAGLETLSTCVVNDPRKPYQEDHQPSVDGDISPVREDVKERNAIQEEERGEGGLVVE